MGRLKIEEVFFLVWPIIDFKVILRKHSYFKS